MIGTATRIDQYVTPRDSQVIFFFGTLRLTYRFRLLSSRTKAAGHGTEQSRIFFSCIFPFSDYQERRILLSLFDDVQYPREEVGHVSVQSREAGPGATCSPVIQLKIYFLLAKMCLIPIPPETTPVRTKTPSWATTKGPPLSPFRREMNDVGKNKFFIPRRQGEIISPLACVLFIIH